MTLFNRPSPAIKWNTRQRLEYIETMAFYAGVVSRSDLVRAFGLSDPAATKILKQYNDLAADNLHYQQSVFGFVPSDSFQAVFADLSPEIALPLIASNLAAAGIPVGEQPIYGIPAESLTLPNRFPDKQVLAQITQAIKQHRKVDMIYHSLSGRDNSQPRMIEPHSLVNTGLRWHVRAYSNNSFDFRDFVLSRIIEARLIDEKAESSAEYDEAWMDIIPLQLAPHPGLDKQQQMVLALDYNAKEGVIELQVRRALVGYILQQLAVDTTADYSLNPNAYPLIVINRDEIEPFAGWAFL